MLHSPCPIGRGPAAAHASGRPGRAARAGVALLLALAAGLPGATAAQAVSPYPDAAAAPASNPSLESALAAEPFGGPEPRGAGAWSYGLLLGGGALAAVAAGLVLRARRAQEPDPVEPLLVFAPPAVAPPALPLPAPARPRAAPAAPEAAPRPQVRVPMMVAPAPAAEVDDALTVRLEFPAEGRVQFLPGALEVVGGAERQREIRFLRTGEPVAEYTIGRTGGAPHRHVQLSAPTVSRLHARMRFAGGSWSITNLSSTNPLRVNGRELRVSEESRVLADGDRIEVGEVVLLFRGVPR